MDRNCDESQRRPEYLSYLLRLWRVIAADQVVWRASLECPHTGERLGFADLGSVWDFLQARMGSENGPAPEGG